MCRVGTGGRTVTNQQSHATLLLSTTEENTDLRWMREPVYKARSVRAGTGGRRVPNQPTISCYSLIKHYRGEYRPEMEDRACIQGPVCESVRVGTGGRRVTNQQSHATLLLSTTEKNTDLRWMREPVYRAGSVRVGTGGRMETNQQSHATVLLSTTEKNTNLRWMRGPVYRAPSVRVGTGGCTEPTNNRMLLSC
jgi:hypothetical protein